MLPVLRIGFLSVTLVDILDIGLLTWLLYRVYIWMAGTSAARLFVGYLVVYLTYLLMRILGMELIGGILGQFVELGVLAAIVLFQQDIRRFLIAWGSTYVREYGILRRFFAPKDLAKASIDTVWATDLARTAHILSEAKIGALVVLSRSEDLGGYVEFGKRIDALVSEEVLLSIFQPSSPLHDGAVIIQHGRILAAHCVLPIHERKQWPSHMSLRHRAALGMAEATDSLVWVISEETGRISMAWGSKLITHVSQDRLRKSMETYFKGGSPSTRGGGA